MKQIVCLAVAVAGLGLLSVLAGCGAPQGPHLRVATASVADLERVKGQDNVWYEFQPGDIVPVHFAFLGAVDGGDENPALLRAKRHFFFVMDSQGMMHLSFDGKTYASIESSKSVIAVLPREDGKGAQLGWLIYMGESGDVKAELESIARQPKPAK